jgi:hypothetical protein
MDRYKQFSIPENIANMLKKSKWQLEVLDDDTMEATPSAESILLVSEGLSTAIRFVRSAYSAYFSGLDITNNTMRAPYPDFYHGRSIIAADLAKSDSLSTLRVGPKAHLELLLKYILSSCSRNYEEATEQFHRGVVSQIHFDKLFCPEEIVVRSTDVGTMAYYLKSMKRQREYILLECWNWEFDGQFYKSHTHWEVPRLSRAGEVPINSLALYPLRVDEAQLRSQLYKRGKAYWEFRDRTLVEYNSLDSAMELQSVSMTPNGHGSLRLTLTQG